MSETPIERAYYNARDCRDDLESAFRSERRTRLDEFTTALDADLQRKYGERIRKAREEESRAHDALLQEKESRAQTKEYPFPLGSVMLEWEYQGARFRAATPRDRVFTGRKGILEVVTRESEHPDNIGSWSRAAVGDLVIRLLKKDGTPSKKYEKPRGQWAQEKWVPEGADLLQEDLDWPWPEVEERDLAKVSPPAAAGSEAQS